MFSLAAFIAYLSVLLFFNKYYIVFFILYPVCFYLIFLEYPGRKKIRKILTWHLVIGTISGTISGIYTHNHFDKDRLGSTNKIYSARVTHVSLLSYTLEIKEKTKKINRIRFRRNPGNPDLFIFDSIQFQCEQWNKSTYSGFYSDLQILQSIHNTCLRGKITEVNESSMAFNNFRRKIQNRISESLDRLPQNSYARGFVMGDTGDINLVELNTFRKMGVAHLFSPSGLHMGLLYGSCYLPFSIAGIPVIGQTAGLIICFFYLCVLDFQIPLLRSFIFIFIYSILKLLKRKSDGKYILYTTCILLEFVFPLSCFTASFILSFFITLIILLFYPVFKKILSLKYARLNDHLAITLAASAGACFLSLHFFNYYHPISVVYNFFLVPPSGIYLAASLLYILFWPFQYVIYIGDYLFRESSWIHYFLIEKNIPRINLFFCKIWVGLFLALTVFLVYHSLKKQFWYLRKYYLRIYGLLALLFFFYNSFNIQPVSGQFAFPYGIIQYRNQDLYITGYLAPFYEKNFSRIIQNLNVPFRNIYSSENFKNLLHKNLVHPLHSINSAPASETKNRIQVDEDCYFFIPYYNTKKNQRPAASCKNIYLIHSKKHSPDIAHYKKVIPDLIPGAKIHLMDYARWQWEYKDKEDAKYCFHNWFSTLNRRFPFFPGDSAPDLSR